MNNKLTIFVGIALILSVIAIVLAWNAYNRSGIDLEQQISNDMMAFEQDVSYGARVMEARMELAMIRTRVEAGQTFEQIEDDFVDVREDIEALYMEAELEASSEWREFAQEIEMLEQQLRDGSADAVDGFQGLLERLENDLQTDEQ